MSFLLNLSETLPTLLTSFDCFLLSIAGRRTVFRRLIKRTLQQLGQLSKSRLNDHGNSRQSFSFILSYSYTLAYVECRYAKWFLVHTIRHYNNYQNRKGFSACLKAAYFTAWIIACPHCCRKVRLLHFSATVWTGLNG